MKSAAWDLRAYLLEKIKKNGGWVNVHNHLDKAYLITPSDLNLAYASLRTKWDLIDQMKQEWSVDQIYDRMAFGVEQQIKQGVMVLCTFIDVDPLIKDKAMLAAERVRTKYQADIKLMFANQTIKGVLDPLAREWFDRAAEFVDIIGGLPYKDVGREAEHIDVLLSTAKKKGQMVHVHVDQQNLMEEKETELLVEKTIEHGMQGKVVAVHAISVAAKPMSYRDQLYQKMAQNQVMVIACPTAWIDHRRNETLMPFHNAVTPVDEMIPAGITVGIGPDDIADYYKPFTDGDMWTELRMLLESCHYYELDELVKIATSNGRKILGI
jgi:cytosine/adenosine deaminase-related metal-dependent hydrolase